VQPSDNKLKAMTERWKAQRAAPGNAPDVPSPQRLQQRELLLARGERALSRIELHPALMAFEEAAGILHAADTEMGLVRTYMQAGQYRRALSFGAHTAGAHLDVIGGTALYAWLLHHGGQIAIAMQLMDKALERQPGQPLAARVQVQLRSGAARTEPALLQPPVRLAPYVLGPEPAQRARVRCAAALLGDARHALAPSWAGSGPCILRNGLGQAVRARPVGRAGHAELLLLRLDNPLPVPDDWRVAARDPFPGSVAMTCGYLEGFPVPDWPWLRTGFIGAPPDPQARLRTLTAGLPEKGAAGPVFDAAGRLAGMALPVGPGQPRRMVGATAWQAAVPPGARTHDRSSTANASPDAVYEAALKTCLQLIA
jgi:hypothetical protein